MSVKWDLGYENHIKFESFEMGLLTSQLNVCFLS